MRISDWSSDVCSSDLENGFRYSVGALLRILLLAEIGQPSHSKTCALRRCGEARTAFNLVCYGLSGRLRGEDDLLQRPFLTRRIIGLVLRIIKLDVRIAGRCILFKARRSEEHTSELQSLMRISYAVFCL